MKAELSHDPAYAPELMEGSARQPVPPEEYLQPRLGHLVTEVLPHAARTWREVGSGFEFVGASFHIPETQASRAALALYDLDREARRAVRVMAGRGQYSEATWEGEAAVLREIQSARGASPRRLLRPTAIDYGGFNLEKAEPGTTEFFLQAYGLLAGILLADPVQFAITLQSILGTTARVLMRIRGPRRETETRDLSQEFKFEGQELSVGGSLAPGSTLHLRYRAGDGTELDIDLETPGQ
jgi:hypothetical protein